MLNKTCKKEIDDLRPHLIYDNYFLLGLCSLVFPLLVAETFARNFKMDDWDWKGVSDLVKKKTSPMETNFEASRRLSVKLKDGGRGPNTEDTRHFVTAVIEFIQ